MMEATVMDISLCNENKEISLFSSFVWLVQPTLASGRWPELLLSLSGVV